MAKRMLGSEILTQIRFKKFFFWPVKLTLSHMYNLKAHMNFGSK